MHHCRVNRYVLQQSTSIMKINGLFTLLWLLIIVKYKSSIFKLINIFQDKTFFYVCLFKYLDSSSSSLNIKGKALSFNIRAKSVAIGFLQNSFFIEVPFSGHNFRVTCYNFRDISTVETLKRSSGNHFF